MKIKIIDVYEGSLFCLPLYFSGSQSSKECHKNNKKKVGIEFNVEGEFLVNPLNLIDYDYAHTLIQWSIIHFYCSSIELQKIKEQKARKTYFFVNGSKT